MPPRKKSISELRRELAAAQQLVKTLQTKRARMLAQVAAVERQIASLTQGAAQTRKKGRKKSRKAAKRRRRRATGRPLTDYVKDVLKKAKDGMRVKDVMAAVTKAGYKTHSKDFYTLVAAALRDTPGFARVSRGVYKLKG